MRQLKIVKQLTLRDSLSVDRYLLDINKIKLISPEEEIMLARRIKEGDEEAFNRLVSANLRFVVSVAKQYQNQGLSLQDLINEGNLGLITAAKKFDETRGFKFISYAVWWIRQSILNAITTSGKMIRIPSNKVGIVNKINLTRTQLEQKLEREPTNSEIAKEMDIDENTLRSILKIKSNKVSIDASFFSEDGNSELSIYDKVALKSYVETDAPLIRESLRIELDSLFSVLSEREISLLKMIYGLDGETPKSISEIGEIMGLTTERVRQIKMISLKKMKRSSKSKGLKQFLV